MNIRHYIKPCSICGTNYVNYERTLNNVELLRCSACDFVYANLKEQSIKAHNSQFDEDAIARYERRQTLINTIWYKNIVKKLTKLSPGYGKVLDVGCGNGILLRQFINQGWVGYGLDLSPWAKKFAHMYGYELYSCELENSSLPSSYFDLVTSTSTLEHIAYPVGHIREIMRVLKRGGVAYLSGMPNYESLSVRLNLSSFSHNIPPGHVNYFTAKSIKKLFSTPDLADNTETLSVKSYGIPESYRLYRYLVQFAFKKPRRSKIDFGKSPTLRLPIVFKTKLKSLSRIALPPVFISIYYYLGRPFNMGDKLEIMVVKR